MDPTDQVKNQGNIQSSVPNPVGSLNKEIAPVSDYVKASEQEPALHPEVEKAGVEVSRNEEPEISFEHKQAGIAKSMPDLSAEPIQPIHLSNMDEKKAIEEIKKDKNVTSSRFWMAMAVLRQIFKRRTIK